MRIVVALGGNALLRRGEPLSMPTQTRRLRDAANALAPLCGGEHQIVITHGNGPQVGLLALQAAAVPETPMPLDVLDAETAGMIGYLLEQALRNALPLGRELVTLLTQVRVDRDDPAFGRPTKPIGPGYDEARARRLAIAQGWNVARDGARWRRVVASPEPREILGLPVVELLVRHGVVVICAGGGGVPVVRGDDGGLSGVAAVIDKDRASALLAIGLSADRLIMLTDVDGVYRDWNTPEAARLDRVTADAIARLPFESGSMGPKVTAAVDFVRATGGRAAIGDLRQISLILSGQAGTHIARDWTDGSASSP